MDGQTVTGRTKRRLIMRYGWTDRYRQNKEKTDNAIWMDRQFQTSPKRRLIMRYGWTDHYRQNKEKTDNVVWMDRQFQERPKRKTIMWYGYRIDKQFQARPNRTERRGGEWTKRTDLLRPRSLYNCSTISARLCASRGAMVSLIGFTLSWGTVWVGWWRKHKQNSS